MSATRKNSTGKRLTRLMIALLMLFGMAQFAIPAAQAKTMAAQPVENIFFYVKNSAGEKVLLRIMSINDLHDNLSHSQGLEPGDKSGDDYFVSYTDNLPTYCYCQGVGFTLDELAEYVEKNMVAPNLAGVSLTFTGEDKMGFIPTDVPIYAGGQRTYNSIYGVDRYYFADLYKYWTAEDFETNYGNLDRDYYDDSAEPAPKYFTEEKNNVFVTGVPMETILMTESYSDRYMYLQDYIDAHGGITGCLNDCLERAESMSIGFPQTEQGMRTGERTASTNTKWIYQVDLDMVNDPVINAEAVAAPTCSLSADGNTATITFACDTPGAAIYHNLVPDGDGYIYQTAAPGSYGSFEENYGVMFPYTGEPIEIDITGLSAMNIRFRAVQEGCSDAGLQTFTYPKAAPGFVGGLQLPLDSDVVLSPSGAPDSEVWTAWTGAITGIGLQDPFGSSYTAIDAVDYTINNTNQTITLDKSLFTALGYYAIQIKANGYQDRVVSRNLKGVAPVIMPAASYILGQAITLTFDDPYEEYGPDASVRVTPPGATSDSSIGSTYLERLAGSITIKESYMAYGSGKIKEPGYYKLTITNNSYMPATQDVYVTVIDPYASYDVSVDDAITGGSVAVNPASAAGGETIVVTVTPAEGKQLVAGSLQYTADGGSTYSEITATGGVYSFNLPAADVTVTAQFKDIDAPLTGDVNGDGMVNVQDVVQIVNFIIGKTTPTPEQFAAADVNEDGSINVQDVVRIVNFIIGKQ